MWNTKEMSQLDAQGCIKWWARRTSLPQADFDRAKKWFQNQAEQTFSPARLINKSNNTYLITLNICKFNFVQKYKNHQIMSLFTQNRQCHVGRKWGTLTDLWGDLVHRISQAMIWLQSLCNTFQNNNFIVYQWSSIWNVSKLPLKTSKTFGFDISPVQFALPQVALNCHKHTETNTPNVTLTLVDLFNMCPNSKARLLIMII